MNKIRVNHKGKRNIYVHNDLSSAAHHFIVQIEDKLKRGDIKGINFEYMACMVMLAFTFEAKINFLGYKCITDWKERQSFCKKVKKVFDYLNINPNWNARPYSAISKLKEFRDLIAHGKPAESEFEEEIVALPEEIQRRNILEGEWQRYCEHENVLNIYEDIDIIWKELLSYSGIQLFETITHGNSSLTLVEKVADKQI